MQLGNTCEALGKVPGVYLKVSTVTSCCYYYYYRNVIGAIMDV